MPSVPQACRRRDTGEEVVALLAGGGWLSQVAGMLAIILAAINVFGGFGVTHRMLMMFNKKKKV